MKTNRKQLSILFLFSLLITTSCHKATKKQGSTVSEPTTYTNPIIPKYLADPYIRFENGYYYFFATGGAEDGRFIPIHRSKDLANWEFVSGAVTNGAKTEWNYMHFWAPEVYKINNKFYLYYTASPEFSPENSGNHVGLAIADSIQGPYQNVGRVIPHASIDGHVFFDTNNSMYLFYTIEHGNEDGLVAGQIYCDKLISPMKVEGKPKQIIHQHPWQEGPFMMHRNNKYYLTYSLGNWRDSTYRVCYSIASSPMGPYTEQPNIILKSNNQVKGAGHHSFFIDQAGKDWIVYHGWDKAFVARYPRIDRIFLSGDKISSDGPSYTPQNINK